MVGLVGLVVQACILWRLRVSVGSAIGVSVEGLFMSCCPVSYLLLIGFPDVGM